MNRIFPYLACLVIALSSVSTAHAAFLLDPTIDHSGRFFFTAGGGVNRIENGARSFGNDFEITLDEASMLFARLEDTGLAGDEFALTVDGVGLAPVDSGGGVSSLFFADYAFALSAGTHALAIDLINASVTLGVGLWSVSAAEPIDDGGPPRGVPQPHLVFLMAIALLGVALRRQRVQSSG